VIAWPLADLIDRLSILTLKADHAPGDLALASECRRLATALRDTDHQRHLAALVNINRRIWDLEADIRQGKEGRLGLDEVGRRALAIRDLNAERIRLKNAIATEIGEFEDVKIDHASAA
jgi:hypothetical protein